MNRLSLIVAVLAIAVWTGCGRSTPGPRSDGPTVTASGKRASVSPTEKDGQSAAMDMEKPLPEGFPRDMVYPGAKVIMASKRAVTDSMVTMDITLTSADPGVKVLEFYEQKLKAEGWDIRYCVKASEGGQLDAAKPREKRRVKVVSSRPNRETKTTASVVFTLGEG